jgi:hypothetical protein
MVVVKEKALAVDIQLAHGVNLPKAIKLERKIKNLIQ